MNNNNSGESNQKKKIRTTWDPNLSKVYSWLKKSEDNDGVVTVFCTWCRAAKKVNQFTEGTNLYENKLLNVILLLLIIKRQQFFKTINRLQLFKDLLNNLIIKN